MRATAFQSTLFLAATAAALLAQGISEHLDLGSKVPHATLEFVLAHDETRFLTFDGRDGQILTVHTTTDGPKLGLFILTPDEGVQYESGEAGLNYRGALYQTGPHVIELFCEGFDPVSCPVRITVGLE